MANGTPARLATVLRVLVLAVSAALVVHILVTADLARVGARLAAIGALVLLALLPYAAAVSLDTAGWRTLLRVLGSRPRFLPLVQLRLSIEAVLVSLPMGPLIAESLKPVLLERRLEVPLSDGVASVACKKALVTLALGLLLATSAVVGWTLLAEASPRLIGGPGLPLVLLAAAAGLALASALGLALFGHGTLATRLHRLLSRLPSAAARRWLAARQRRFADVDGAFAPLLAARGRLVAATLIFLGGWTVELLESYLLLRLVGAEISFMQLFALESSVVLIRSLAAFVPAGLGFQDAGYLAFLRAFAVPDALQVGTAFIALKRGRELFWMIVGYLLLPMQRTRPAAVGAPTAT